MQASVRIAEFESGDTDLLTRCAALVTEYSWGADFPLAPFDEAKRAEHHVCAQDGEKVVGYANVNRFASPDGKDNGEIWFAQVVVHPEYRKQGILTAMYGNCLTYMEGQPGRILACTDNPVMEQFFAKKGWVPVRDTKDEAGEGCHVVEYRR